MSQDKIHEVVQALEIMEADNDIPRNVKEVIKSAIGSLKSNDALKVKVNKALQELDEIADDPNLEPYSRTQIWNVASLLEKIS
jgi:uncharacterized protein (UPF0147 family)